MRLPALKEIPTTRDFIDEFGGYNHNVRIGENEFYDMKNLTSSHYPVFATRNKRGTYLPTSSFAEGLFQQREFPVGFINKDGLCVVTVSEIGTNYQLKIRIGEKVYTFPQLTAYDSSHKRNVVSMGAYIVIFPDNVYINTATINDDEPDMGLIEGSWTKTNNNVGLFFLPYSKDGNIVKIYGKFDKNTQADYLETSTDFDKNDIRGPVNHKYIIETTTGDLYYWSPMGDSGAWFTDRVYFGIYNPGTDFTSKFKVGDGVRIDGFNKNSEVDAEILKDIFNDDIKKPFTVTSVKPNAIVFNYQLSNFFKQEYMTKTLITISKTVPIMDYVIENNNRLWGCRYGKNRFGDIVNEIYVSKLGDFSNWETFSGISTDSYVISVGSPGPFTGAISYLGNPLFFKQDCIHMAYGDYSPYRLQTTECNGVQQGCDESLAIVGGTLFYKSVRGVCAYSGSMPTDIGNALNEQKLSYKNAFASGYKGKYYLSMVDEHSERQLFVYDLDKGMWHKEGAFDGECFCLASWNGFDALYYLQNIKNGDGEVVERIVKIIEGYEGFTDDEKIDWMAETGIIGCYTHDKKYVSRISFRLSTDIGSRVYIFAEYDSSGTWEQIGAITGTSLNTFTFPVRPKRCDHLRLRIEGTDEAKIYSISKTYEQGSDI